MKTAEQKQHEADMQKQREEFAKLWSGELSQSAKSLGIHPTVGVEHLAWLAFRAGNLHQKAR